MRVELAKWGNSAAVRIPAWALQNAGFQIGQSLELHAEGRRLVLEPAAESLEDLLSQITPQNCHALAFDDQVVGAEIW